MALDRDSIRQLQAGLRLLGYDAVGAVDGIAGRNTNAQINAFLADSQSTIDPTDMESVLRYIRESVATDDGAQARLRALAADPTALDADQRRMLQTGLNFSGVTGDNSQPLDVDGRMGPQTRSAVAAFNQSATPEAPAAAPDRALNAEELKLLQGGLIALGYDAGRIDGQSGPRTEAAVSAFLDGAQPGTAALQAVQDAIRNGDAAARMAAIATDPAASANDITALQAALTLNGQNVKLDGIRGPRTREAAETAQAGFAAAAVEPDVEAVVETAAEAEPVVEVPTEEPTNVIVTPLPDPEPLVAVPIERVEVAELAPLPEDIAPQPVEAATVSDLPELPARSVADIEAAQQDILDSPAFGGLDTSAYLSLLRDAPDSFDSLHDTFSQNAADSAFYASLAGAMTALRDLEDERQDLLAAQQADVSPAPPPDSIEAIDAAQRVILDHPTIVALSRDNPDHYLDMMRNSPNLFNMLHESALEKAGPANPVYAELAEAMTGLRALEDQRNALLAPESAAPSATAEAEAEAEADITPPTLSEQFAVEVNAERITPTVATASVALVHQDNPFGMGEDTMGALLIASMAEYRHADPHVAETQFVADRLHEIFGTREITMTDAAFALNVYRETGSEVDYGAVERAANEVGAQRNDRFDLGNPTDMSRILTGLAALSQGGLENVTSGTADAIAQVSGHRPEGPAVADDPAIRTTIGMHAGM